MLTLQNYVMSIYVILTYPFLLRKSLRFHFSKSKYRPPIKYHYKDPFVGTIAGSEINIANIEIAINVLYLFQCFQA